MICETAWRESNSENRRFNRLHFGQPAPEKWAQRPKRSASHTRRLPQRGSAFNSAPATSCHTDPKCTRRRRDADAPSSDENERPTL